MFHPKRLISFENDENLLCIRGLVVDVVSEVVEDLVLFGNTDYIIGSDSTWSLDDPAHIAAISFFTRAFELAQKTISSRESLLGGSTSLVREYLMTLFADNHINAQLEEAYHDAWPLFTSCDWTKFTNLEHSRWSRMQKCLGRLRHIIGHSFFATKAGRFGLAHPGCKVGDKVCVFYGSQALNMLRMPEEQGPGHRGPVKFCGLAFIPHLMDLHEWETARLSDDEIFKIS